jgi:hypothetical protein
VLRRRMARRHGRRRARRLRLAGAFLTRGYGTALGTPRHGEHRGSVTRSSRHDGGAASTGLGGRGGARREGQGPVLPIRSRRARAGVHACVLRGVRRRAREGMLATRTRRGARHGAAATDGTGANAKRRRKGLGGRRALDDGSGTCKNHPSLARWPASPAMARGRGARCGGAMAGASTRDGKRMPSPRWPRAEV